MTPADFRLVGGDRPIYRARDGSTWLFYLCDDRPQSRGWPPHVPRRAAETAAAGFAEGLLAADRYLFPRNTDAGVRLVGPAEFVAADGVLPE